MEMVIEELDIMLQSCINDGEEDGKFATQLKKALGTLKAENNKSYARGSNVWN